MGDFNSSLVIPVLATHLQRGGGPALLYIQMTDDFTAVASGADWEALTLIQKTDFSNAPGSGQKQDLSITFVDGVKYSTKDNAIDESPDVGERSFQIAMTDASVFNLPASTKGKKYFFCYPIKFIGTTKVVEFGFGEFKREFGYPQDWGQYIIFNVGIAYQESQLASTPTFPVLPANTDALYTTAEANMRYLGWVLPTADAAKGGFGNAVAVPNFTDLPGTKAYVVKSF